MVKTCELIMLHVYFVQAKIYEIFQNRFIISRITGQI